MNACREMAPLLPLAPDEMNDRALADSLRAHLDSCPNCRERQALFARVREATRRNATRHAAPLGLHERIATALHAEEAAAAKRPFAEAGRGLWFSLVSGWFTAGAMACLVFVVLEFGPRPQQPAAPAIALADAADIYIDNHARALVTNHLIDVVSSDRHTVKPWFRGRLDFSPPVVDLADQGYPLIGGRLDYVAHRDVAVLVYQRRQHVIDVYVWPDATASDAPPTTASHGALGYRVIAGWAAGTAFAAVSDLDPAELGEMTQAFAQRLQRQATDGMRQ